MKLRFLDPAEEEMLRAAQLYEDQATGLGERFLDEVEGCVELLLDQPNVGRQLGKCSERMRSPADYALSLAIFPLTCVGCGAASCTAW